MSLWLRIFLACGLLSVMTLGGLLWWQQRSFAGGFVAYLDAVAQQRAQLAVQRLEQEYAEHGSWDALRADPMRMGQLVEPHPARRDPGNDRRAPPTHETAAPQHDGEARKSGPRPWERDDEGGPGPGGRDQQRPHGPMPRSDDLAIGMRLRLTDAQHAYVAGYRGDRPTLDPTPILHAGATVGWLAIASLPPAPDSLESAFARSQWRNAAVAAVLALGLALLLGLVIARRVVGPVRQLSLGTQALAAGDYSLRIDAGGRDEIAALARDFNHLAATLDQHREARRRWGQDIAHELRTPLTVLQAELQTLIDGIRPVTPAALTSLLAECERLTGLVADLNQLELAGAAALEYRFDVIDFAEVIDERLANHRGGLQSAGLQLSWSAPSDAAWVRGDRQRLGQLIDNLLLNARRYTDAPGQVRLALRVASERWVLCVEDSAPGVDDAELTRLFDRLYRVERSRTREQGGAGLGLAICRAIADAHGATLVARHSPLGGVEIAFALDRVSGPAPPRSSTAPRPILPS